MARRLAEKLVRTDDVRGYLTNYRARVYQHNQNGTIYRGVGVERTGHRRTVWIRARPLGSGVKLEFYDGEECPCTL